MSSRGPRHTRLHAAATETTQGLCLEYPLREDFVAQLVIPRQLTEVDIDRLKAFIETLRPPAARQEEE